MRTLQAPSKGVRAGDSVASAATQTMARVLARTSWLIMQSLVLHSDVFALRRHLLLSIHLFGHHRAGPPEHVRPCRPHMMNVGESLRANPWASESLCSAQTKHRKGCPGNV